MQRNFAEALNIFRNVKYTYDVETKNKNNEGIDKNCAFLVVII